MNHDQSESHRVAYRRFGVPLPYVRVSAGVVEVLDGIRWRLS